GQGDERERESSVKESGAEERQSNPSAGCYHSKGIPGDMPLVVAHSSMTPREQAKEVEQRVGIQTECVCVCVFTHVCTYSSTLYMTGAKARLNSVLLVQSRFGAAELERISGL